MFATLKIALVYGVFGSIAAIFGIPYSLLIQDIGPLYRVAMRIVTAGLSSAGVRVDVRGLEHIPEGRACIFMCNHVSNLDPPVIMPLIPGRTSVLLKQELMKIPLLGTAMRMARFIPVARSRSRESAQQSVSAAAEALKSGLHILVFPEGTRSRDGRLSTFKKGPFFLARETGAPVVPVAVSGTQKMLPKGSVSIHPGTATMTFQPPIDPAAFHTREDLMQAVRRSLAAALPDEMKPATI